MIASPPGWARLFPQAVSRLQHVDTRHQVWKELGVLGDTVFPTVAPFIRVSSRAT